jgi:[ribosomal protein S18]-alanine N-acetyltransferase
MSALFVGSNRSAPHLAAMTQHDVNTVLRVEQAAYAFPWSRANFIDSLAAGHACHTLGDARGAVLGYFVLLPGFEEMHLLNLTVAPGEQSRGRGRLLLGSIVQLCQSCAARELWLEVRQGNLRAQRIYERFGFQVKGVRKGYYPAALGRREDAIVMRLKISDASQSANNALE